MFLVLLSKMPKILRLKSDVKDSRCIDVFELMIIVMNVQSYVISNFLHDLKLWEILSRVYKSIQIQHQMDLSLSLMLLLMCNRRYKFNSGFPAYV